MAEGGRDKAYLILLGINNDKIRALRKHLLPFLNQSGIQNGFVVHPPTCMEDNWVQMHELSMPTSQRGELNMELDSSLDLTEGSSSFSIIGHSFSQQPISVDSGPQGIHGNMVTSSTSTAMNINQSTLLYDIKVLEVPYDSEISELVLYYCLGHKTLILLLLDSELLDIPEHSYDDGDMETNALIQYKEFVQIISAVSSLHGVKYKVMLAGFKGQQGSRNNVFSIIRRYLDSTQGLDAHLHDEHLIIDNQNSMDKLNEALRNVCSKMDEGSDRRLVPIELSYGQKNYQSLSSQVELREKERNEENLEKNLTFLSVIVEKKKKENTKHPGINTEVVQTSTIMSAVSSRQDLDLHDSVNTRVDELISMGCLIPCYRKLNVEKGDFILHYLNKTDDLLTSHLEGNIKAIISPVLRIQIRSDDGQVHINAPLLISCIVSECSGSWDIARQGNKVCINKLSVAFSANHNAVRLVVSIDNGNIYLLVTDYSVNSEGATKPIDRQLCQKLLTHVNDAIHKLYGARVTIEHSIRCMQTEGALSGDIGWMDVEDLRQSDKGYICTFHNNPPRHTVLLADTLQVWFPVQTDAGSQPEQGMLSCLPDSSTDLPCAALPEIAGCFGRHWDLFFISHDVSSEDIERLKLQQPNDIQGQIHEALKLLKKVDKYRGKLSFGNFKNLVYKYNSVSFSFERYDKIVKRFEGPD